LFRRETLARYRKVAANQDKVYATIARRFEFLNRFKNLTWKHHYEVASIKTLAEADDGKLLRRVDEAKQWAIGDWLVDGKRHYGDGLYEKAAGILGLEEQTLRLHASMADRFQLLMRVNNLSWDHHRQVASIKTLAEADDGKLYLSDETDHKIWDLWLACWSETEIAQSIGKSRELVSDRVGILRKNAEITNPTPLSVYNVWQFGKCDERFGIDYPGFSPNTLSRYREVAQRADAVTRAIGSAPRFSSPRGPGNTRPW